MADDRVLHEGECFVEAVNKDADHRVPIRHDQILVKHQVLGRLGSFIALQARASAHERTRTVSGQMMLT